MDERVKAICGQRTDLPFIGILIYSLIGILLFGCSTTKHLPERWCCIPAIKTFFKDPVQKLLSARQLSARPKAALDKQYYLVFLSQV